jgi:hypothetical protein
MQIKARTKYLDLKENFSLRQLYAVIGFVAFLSIIAVILFAWIQDWLISLTFLLSAFVGFILFSQSAKPIEVEILEDSLRIDDYQLPFNEIVSWAAVDLGETIEIVLLTKSYTTPYLYFYIPDNDKETFEFVKIMRSVLFYDQVMPNQNYIHRFLRFVGLK